MGGKLTRGGGLVAAAAVIWALLSPGVAAADGEQAPKPILTGDCAATFGNADEVDGSVSSPKDPDGVDGVDGVADTDTADTGSAADADDDAKPVTVDAAAAAGRPDTVTVGTGNESAGTSGQPEPLVTFPVREILDDTGSSDGAIGDTTTGVCEVAEPVVNDLGEEIQQTLPSDDPERPEPETHSGGQADSPQADFAQADSPQGSAHGGATEPEADTSTAPDGDTSTHPDMATTNATDAEGVLDDSLDGIVPITPPSPASDPSVTTPELDQPEASEGDPDVRAEAPDTGSKELLPGHQARLPLVLAILALTGAVTTVSRRVACHEN